MRKKLSLFSLLLVFASTAGIIFTACSHENKNRLSTNTATVSIDPINPGTIAPGASVQFSAIVRNNGNDVNTGVNWTCEPSTLGAFNPNGVKVTTFTAAQTTTTVYGTITADAGGIRNSVNIIVGSGTVIVPDNILITGVPSAALNNNSQASLTATVRAGSTAITPQPTVNWAATDGSVPASSTGGSPVTYTAPLSGAGTSTITVTYGSLSANAYIIYGTTTPVAPAIKVLMQNGNYTAESGLNDMWWWRTSGQIYIGTTLVSGIGYDGQSRTLREFDFKDYNGNMYNNWDGLQFAGPAADYSQYNTLVFYAKGVSPSDTKIVVNFANTTSGSTPNQGIFAINNVTWTKCEIPLTIERTSVETPFVVVYSQFSATAPDTQITPPSSVLVDYVYVQE